MHEQVIRSVEAYQRNTYHNEKTCAAEELRER
jgi:hypothetical protein